MISRRGFSKGVVDSASSYVDINVVCDSYPPCYAVYCKKCGHRGYKR